VLAEAVSDNRDLIYPAAVATAGWHLLCPAGSSAAPGSPLALLRPAPALIVYIDFFPRKTDQYLVFVFAKAHQEAAVGPMPASFSIFFRKGITSPIEYQNVVLGLEDDTALRGIFFSGAVGILLGNGL
jgi:hypothetical protein